MRVPSLILVLPLSGCHLFSSGVIDCTLQGPPSCFEEETGEETGHTGDTETAEEELVLARGLVLSFEADDAWWAQAWTPPTWEVGRPALTRTGGVNESAPLYGPADYDEESGTIFVASPSSSSPKLYRLFSADSTNPTQTFALGDQAVTAVAAAEGVAWLAGGSTLSRLDPESGSGVEEVPLVDASGATLAVGSMLAVAAGSQGVALVVVDGDGRTDLLTLEVADQVERIVATVEEDDFTKPDDVDVVDLFRGPDDAPWVCDRSGQMFAVASLAGGGSYPDLTPDRDEDSQVLACGWDDSLEAFLFVSVKGGVFAVDSAGGTTRLLEPEASGYEIHGAGLF